jgi:hypothetical protein
MPCSITCMFTFNSIHVYVQLHASPCPIPWICPMCTFVHDCVQWIAYSCLNSMHAHVWWCVCSKCILIFKIPSFSCNDLLISWSFCQHQSYLHLHIWRWIVWPYSILPWLRIGQPRNVSKARHGVLICLRKFSLHTKQLIEGSKNWNSINYYNWAMDAKKKDLNLRILLFQFTDFSCIFYSWFQCHHLWPILTLHKSVGSYFNKIVIWLLSKSMNLQSQYMLMVYDSTYA